MDNYDFKKIEENWQSIWEKNKLASCDVTLNKNNFYNLNFTFLKLSTKSSALINHKKCSIRYSYDLLVVCISKIRFRSKL